MSNFTIPKWVKVLMLKGEKGERPTITTETIDNGSEITFSYPDGTSESVEVHNATSGDYSGLTNKPSINGTLLNGNKTGADLSLANSSDVYTKEEVDEIVSPSEWIDLQDYLNTSVVDLPTSTGIKWIRGRRIGNKAHIRGRLVVVGTATANTLTVLKNLPVELAPTNETMYVSASGVYFTKIGNAPDKMGELFALSSYTLGDTNSVIMFFQTSANRNGMEINVNWEYFVD